MDYNGLPKGVVGDIAYDQSVRPRKLRLKMPKPGAKESTVRGVTPAMPVKRGRR